MMVAPSRMENCRSTLVLTLVLQRTRSRAGRSEANTSYTGRRGMVADGSRKQEKSFNDSIFTFDFNKLNERCEVKTFLNETLFYITCRLYKHTF